MKEDQYSATFKRYTKYTLYLTALFVLGWGFTPYQSIFQGLLLGTVFSYINLLTAHRRIARLGQAITEGKKMYSLGMLQRFAYAILAVLIATRYPEHFHLVSVVIGLMITYIIILIDSLFQIKNLSHRKR